LPFAIFGAAIYSGVVRGDILRWKMDVFVFRVSDDLVINWKIVDDSLSPLEIITT